MKHLMAVKGHHDSTWDFPELYQTGRNVAFTITGAADSEAAPPRYELTER